MRVGKVEFTAGFLLLAAWLFYLDDRFVVPLALCAGALHEAGHYAAIRRMGGDIRCIRLTAVGAEMELSGGLSYLQEGIAALAGPGVSLLTAVLFSFWEGGRLFSGLNLVFGCFNLLPLGRLDGGRALRCTLALCAGPDAADRVGNILNGLFPTLFLAVGIRLLQTEGNGTFLLMAVWLTAVSIFGICGQK